MGKIVIFDEISKSLEKNPRDVTLFGETDLVYTPKDSYDLYYFSLEGIGHEKILDPNFQPMPIFSWNGNHENLMHKIKSYHETYNNSFAGVCGNDIFG